MGINIFMCKQNTFNSLPQLDGNRQRKNEDMDLEHNDEKRSELVKHFNEEVPE